MVESIKLILRTPQTPLLAKQRLDSLLIERNLCSSRQLAQRLIRAGEVMVNQQVIDKPGTEIDTQAQIQVKQRSPLCLGAEKNSAKQ